MTRVHPPLPVVRTRIDVPITDQVTVELDATFVRDLGDWQIDEVETVAARLWCGKYGTDLDWPALADGPYTPAHDGPAKPDGSIRAAWTDVALARLYADDDLWDKVIERVDDLERNPPHPDD